MKKKYHHEFVLSIYHLVENFPFINLLNSNGYSKQRYKTTYDEISHDNIVH